MVARRVSVVFYYKGSNKYGINAIAGAIESQPDLSLVRLKLVPDLESTVQAARSELEEADTVLVGWSFFSPDVRAVSAALKAFRASLSDSRLIHLAGGVHATAEPTATLAMGFDFAAIGEGEQTIIDSVRSLLEGKSLKGTRGLAWRTENTVARGPPAVQVDLNDFPPFAVGQRRFGAIEITRGCIYACKFCQTPFMFKARFRHRSVENVCKYVRIMRDHGLTDIRFITPTSLSYGATGEAPNLGAVEELLSSVRATLGEHGRIFFGSFPSEVRPEHVTPEALAVLRRYVNNDNLVIGGQSGSEHVLSLSHRGHDVAVIERAVRTCISSGFLPNVDLIFGLPGETSDDVRQSLAFAERLVGLGARIHNHTFMPLPGTPFKNQPPGTIDPGTLEKLRKLESRGVLYGDWKHQIEIAKDLARERT